MARKKQAATKAEPNKKSAKKTTAKTIKAAASKASKKTAAPKPVKSESKRTKHAAVAPESVLSALNGGKILTKKELVSACGGDDVAVTKAVNKLRGEGKVVVTGSTRNAVYSKAA